MTDKVPYTPFHRNHVPVQDPDRRSGRKAWMVMGIVVVILILVAVFLFASRPVLKEGLPADQTVYTVNVLYSLTSHENEVNLYDEDIEFQSDTPAEHFAMTSAVEEQLESLLQSVEMNRTVSWDHSLRTYNIDRFTEDSHLSIYCGEEETLIQRGQSWYRVTDPAGFFLGVSSILDSYIEICEREE